jgi:hypothetical protein
MQWMQRASSADLRLAVCAGAWLALSGCGGKPAETPVRIEHEQASTQILRVAQRWQASQHQKGLRSAPSRVSVFEVRIDSRLDLQNGGPKVRETLEVSESFELRDGRRFRCSSSTTLELQAHYGRRHAEPAVELIRPATRLERRCQPPDYPEPVLELPAQSARFVLSDDQLRAFAPPLEKRVYLPLN